MIQINFWDDIFDADNMQYKYLNHTILHQKKPRIFLNLCSSETNKQ